MTDKTRCKQLELESEIINASAYLNCLWPLTSFVATNSLKGLESLNFDLAMHNANKLMGAQGYLDLTKYRELFESGRINSNDLKEAFENYNKSANFKKPSCVNINSTLSEYLDFNHQQDIVANINRQVIKWCSAYFDTTQAQWSMERKRGFFESFCELIKYDYSLSIHGLNDWKTILKDLPVNSKQALEWLLDLIGVEENIADYLRGHLIQLPGWGSYLKWKQSNGEDDLLIDYLAIRLFYEFNYAKPIVKSFYNLEIKPWSKLSLLSKTEPCNELAEKINYAGVWQDAYEINYRNELIDKLSCGVPTQELDLPQSQLVFCIDVRSEPIRRQLERIGPYSTYGYAGFFGFAMRYKELGSNLSVDLCPVLISPQKNVSALCEDKSKQNYISAKTLLAMIIYLRKRLKSSLMGAFGLVESFGLCSSLPLLGKTFFPKAFKQGCDKLNHYIAGEPKIILDTVEFSLAEKIDLAISNLKGMGLTKNFASVIVLCGHKSLSTNNPYASALDCGACGGNAGGINAKLAATILNDRQVRQHLRDSAIFIPDETIFLAAEHNTTTDRIEIFDTDLVNDHQQKIIAQLKIDLIQSGNNVQKWRSQSLPQSVIKALNNPSSRACDWAQTVPEWGLVRNAAFIAAPRSLTKDLDLMGRTFLHSYDFSEDPSGEVLETIMTAPLIVAQMINIQYYLSSVDNKVFGSGSKVLHNVVGDFGVMQGASSDLKLGLPIQSVMASQGILEHEPMRLLVLIRAPLNVIDRILSRHENLANLVKNRWIKLLAMDPSSNIFYQADDISTWQAVKTADPKYANA